MTDLNTASETVRVGVRDAKASRRAPPAALARNLRLGFLIVLMGLGHPARAEQLSIGVGAPLSGPDGIFGEQIRLGVEQAVADANASGGFLGETAHVVPGDDGGDPKRGVEVAKRFVAAKIPFVVGHFSSAVAVPASTIYAQAGILDITPSAIEPLVTERGLATVFRTCGREDQQAAVAARYLAAHFSRIAIVHDRTSDGKILADAVRHSLSGTDAKEVFYGSLEKGTRDYPGLVARLKTSGAQAVFWGGTQTEAGLLAHQLHDANSRIVLMGGFGIASDEFATLAGPGADGTLIVFPQDPRRRPAATNLLRRLQAKGVDPAGTTFYAYAAVQVFREAARAATSLDPSQIAAAIHSGMVFKTVLGDLTFDAKGDPTVSDLAVYVWHRGASGRMAYDDQADS